MKTRESYRQGHHEENAKPNKQTLKPSSRSVLAVAAMPAVNVKYTAVPTEPEPMAAVADMLQVTGDERHDFSRTSSRTYSDTSEPDQQQHPDRRRHDRRRGRLNSELLTAVQEGDLHAATRLLDEGASVNATCRPSRTTVVQLATVRPHVSIVQLLLSRGANVKRRDRAGRQAVHFAAAGGYDVILGMLLEADPTLVDSRISTDTTDPRNADNYDSWSHDHDSVISLLPALSGGSTPLHLATQRGHYRCVDLLLGYNANVSVIDDRGLTPLDVSGEIKPLTRQVPQISADDIPVPGENVGQPTPTPTPRGVPIMRARMMKARFLPSEPSSDASGPENRFGVDLTPEVPSDTTPAPPPPLPLPTNSIQRIVNALIGKGAKIPTSKVIVKGGSVVNQIKMPVTCLHTAVEAGDTELIQFLLKNGACVVTWNDSGETAIHLAVAKRLVEPLRVLLEWNKSSTVVDARDSKGRTPLHLAVTEQWAPGVSILLEAGADVGATSNDNQTVLHLAASEGNPKLLEELLSIPESGKIMDWRNKSYETPLCCAVSAGHVPCVNLLLEHGADFTTTMPGDVTLLHIAAENGNARLLELLMRNSKVMDSLKDVRSTEGKGGMTPLHVACWHGYVDCAQILINAGSSLYAKTTESPYFGATPLHLAARQGHVEVVERVLGHDRETLAAKNSDNWYPLHVAARFAHKDCVREMLKHGANLAATIVDSGGYRKTGLDIIAFSIVDPACFFEEIFDYYIEVNEYPLNNPKCLIKVKYDLLMPLGAERKQLRVLDALLNCSKQGLQQKLLQHPLVETFLFLKWMRLRVFFVFIMALYFTFTLSLTIMALFTYVFKTEDIVTTSTVTSCRIVTLVSLVLIIIQELLHASRLQRYYITDMESWVKWSAFLTGAVVVVCNHNVWWLIHVTSVAVLLAWLELLFLFSRCPSAIGFYVLMFFTVANNVVKVMATFIFVILGFTFAFLIHFRAQAPFSTLWEALVKVIVMTTEFEYAQMFEPFPGVTPASVVGRSIFIAFVILVAIVLMNLLVGLAVSDIATLEAQGRTQRLAKQIDFLSLLEIFVYNKRILSCLPRKVCSTVKRQRLVVSYICIEPGKPSQGVYQVLPHQLRQSVVTKVANQKKTEDEVSLTELNGKIDQLAKMAERAPRGRHTNKMLSASNSTLNESVLTETQTKAALEKILSELAVIKSDIEELKQKNNKPLTSLSLYPDNKPHRGDLIYC